MENSQERSSLKCDRNVVYLTIDAETTEEDILSCSTITLIDQKNELHRLQCGGKMLFIGVLTQNRTATSDDQSQIDIVDQKRKTGFRIVIAQESLSEWEALWIKVEEMQQKTKPTMRRKTLNFATRNQLNQAANKQKQENSRSRPGTPSSRAMSPKVRASPNASKTKQVLDLRLATTPVSKKKKKGEHHSDIIDNSPTLSSPRTTPKVPRSTKASMFSPASAGRNASPSVRQQVYLHPSSDQKVKKKLEPSEEAEVSDQPQSPNQPPQYLNDVTMQKALMVKKQNGARFEGLKNLGNTCYLNAVVQALRSLPMFIQSLEDFDYPGKKKIMSSLSTSLPLSIKTKKTIEDGKVLFAFLESMNEIRTNQNQVVDIRRLKDVVSERSSVYAGYQQQDAHEFFLTLLNEMHDDMLRLLNCQPMMNSTTMEATSADKENAPNEISNYFHTAENTSGTAKLKSVSKQDEIKIDQNLSTTRFFLSKVAKVLSCRECQYTRSSLETFRVFSLDLPKQLMDRTTLPSSQEQLSCRCNHPAILRHSKKENENYGRAFYTCSVKSKTSPGCSFFHWAPHTTSSTAIPLSKLFQLHFESHEVEINCEQCDSGKIAQVSYVFKHLPSILVVHLKRFQMNYANGTLSKRLDRIHVPDTLFPEEQWSESSLHSDKYYELKAIVHHQGVTAAQGHYVTDVQDASNTEKWTRYDDSVVKELEKDSIHSQGSMSTAYILLYVKKE